MRKVITLCNCGFGSILEGGLFNVGIGIFQQLPWRYTWQDLKDKFKGAGKSVNHFKSICIILTIVMNTNINKYQKHSHTRAAESERPFH